MRELCAERPGWTCRALPAAGGGAWQLEGDLPRTPWHAGAEPGRVEVLFCRRGGLYLEQPDGRRVALRPGQALFLDGGGADCRARSGGEVFGGVLVSLDEGRARAGLRAHCPGLAGDPPPDHGCRAVTAVLWCEAFFHTLEQLPPGMQGNYCALKAEELLFLLHAGGEALLHPQGDRYYDRFQLQAVEGVRAYMEQHLAEHLTIPELARRFHLSATLLKACFRQVYGVPVHQYLLEQRMVRAAGLLAGTRWSVAAVAAAVGYSGTGQFSTAFRARYGMAPARYRQAARRIPTAPEPPL